MSHNVGYDSSDDELSYKVDDTNFLANPFEHSHLKHVEYTDKNEEIVPTDKVFEILKHQDINSTKFKYGYEESFLLNLKRGIVVKKVELNHNNYKYFQNMIENLKSYIDENNVFNKILYNMIKYILFSGLDKKVISEFIMNYLNNIELKEKFNDYMLLIIQDKLDEKDSDWLTILEKLRNNYCEPDEDDISILKNIKKILNETTSNKYWLKEIDYLINNIHDDNIPILNNVLNNEYINLNKHQFFNMNEILEEVMDAKQYFKIPTGKIAHDSIDKNEYGTIDKNRYPDVRSNAYQLSNPTIHLKILEHLLYFYNFEYYCTQNNENYFLEGENEKFMKNGKYYHKMKKSKDSNFIRYVYMDDNGTHKYGIWDKKNDELKVPDIFSDSFRETISVEGDEMIIDNGEHHKLITKHNTYKL